MGDATPEYWVSVLDEGVALLDRLRAPYVVIGSLATGAYLERPWRTTEDIDFFVRGDDAEGILDAFRGEGFAVYRKDARWLFKAARPNVTIDLIFLASEVIELDDDIMGRSWVADFRGVPLRVPGREDLLTMKAITDALDRRGHWYDCLELVAQGDVDWDLVADRALAHGSERMLAFLLYARTAGASVPDRVVKTLASEVLP